MRKMTGTLVCVLYAACGATPAPMKEDMPPPAGDMSMGGDMSSTTMCQPMPTDFQPGKANTGWMSCVSDNGQYNAFNPNSVSTIARIAAFEAVADLLWKGDKQPTKEDFFNAALRIRENEGLQSRLDRREDEHYPPVLDAMNKTVCSNLAMAMANPDRCVGPARMAPLINGALADGGMEKEPRVNAARVEAGLLWFLFISTHKEAITCGGNKNDCDSSWTYYTGGEQRGGGKGLSRYVRMLEPATHDRAFDGILAVRCWRDLDPATPAMNTALRDRAVGQMDRALHRGVAVIVRDRLGKMKTRSGDQKLADLAFVKILGGSLLREARTRDMAKAAALQAELDKTDAAQVNVEGAQKLLDELFPCP